ncbi:hypothetical protein CLOM_g5252 [Closterium sp. NIES-68]|nr:hypothetical protein CLOM_g5252 [Closterium sp. NIES-68]GJP67592.1 hypothetical protein CLOP_g24397 [Closterium sp. NIES-67]
MRVDFLSPVAISAEGFGFSRVNRANSSRNIHCCAYTGGDNSRAAWSSSKFSSGRDSERGRGRQAAGGRSGRSSSSSSRSSREGYSREQTAWREDGDEDGDSRREEGMGGRRGGDRDRDRGRAAERSYDDGGDWSRRSSSARGGGRSGSGGSNRSGSRNDNGYSASASRSDERNRSGYSNSRPSSDFASPGRDRPTANGRSLSHTRDGRPVREPRDAQAILLRHGVEVDEEVRELRRQRQQRYEQSQRDQSSFRSRDPQQQQQEKRQQRDSFGPRRSFASPSSSDSARNSSSRRMIDSRSPPRAASAAPASPPLDKVYPPPPANERPWSAGDAAAARQAEKEAERLAQQEARLQRELAREVAERQAERLAAQKENQQRQKEQTEKLRAEARGEAQQGDAGQGGAGRAGGDAEAEGMGGAKEEKGSSVVAGEEEKTAEAAKSRSSSSSSRRKAGDDGGEDALVGRSLEEMEQLAMALGEQKYRGKQLHQFVYSNQGCDLSDLKQLPLAFRERLAERGVVVGRPPVHHVAAAADGTAKLLLRLADNRLVETVGIPMEGSRKGAHHLTACISSQVGCPLRCSFCATGKGGFARNLRAHEIVAQVLAVQQLFQHRVTNIVFMGMGEPLLNLPAVLRAHKCLNQDVGIGQRNMTISTVGVPNAIARLASHKLQSTLAVSLHAPNQQLREALVPSAKAYPIEALLADCRAYFNSTGRRVSFEYTLLAGVNDQVEHARELAALLRRHGVAHHVNVIPFNPISDSLYKRPSKAYVMAFVEELRNQRITASVRHTRGMEANAACGQLRNDFQKVPLSMATPVEGGEPLAGSVTALA